MGTTPTYSWPYPEPTDPVADGAQNIEDLALAVETTVSGVGTATAFTPSWNNLTPGNASETWYYTQVNDLVLVQGQIVFGSTTSITGAVEMNHPIGSAIVENMIIGHSYCVGGGDLRVGMVQATPGEITPYVYTIDGTYIDRDPITATSPFTWTSGYSLRMSYLYQLS